MFIQGSNVAFYIEVSASPVDLKPVGCARNVQVTMQAETAETTTEGSGTTRTYEAQATSWTASVDGLSVPEGEPQLTARDLFNYCKALGEVTMQFDPDDGGSPLIGNVIFTQVQTSANYNDAAVFSCSMQGTGELVTA